MDSFLAVWQSGLILVLHSEQNHNLVVSRLTIHGAVPIPESQIV